MIYLLDEKEKRQCDYGWTKEQFEKYKNIIIPIHTYNQLSNGKNKELFQPGNLVLFHESFFDNKVNNIDKDGLTLREQLNKYANNHQMYVAYFSGSKSGYRVEDNIAYLPVENLYRHLECFVKMVQLNCFDWGYLIYGENSTIEGKLIELQHKKLDEYYDESEIINNAKIIIFQSSDYALDIISDNCTNIDLFTNTIETNQLDEYIKRIVQDKLSIVKYDKIIVPLCFGPQLSEYNGLKLATYIRRSNIINNQAPIYIYGVVGYSDLMEHSYCNILKDSNVELIDFSYKAIVEIMNQNNRDYKLEMTLVEEKNQNISKNVEYLSSQIMYSFLQSYNQDLILKYTCHDIDDEDVINNINQECGVEEYDYQKHYELIKKHYNDLKNKYKDNDKSLRNIKGLFDAYLKMGENEVPWGVDKVQESWGGNILEWALKNPHIIPNPGANIASKQESRGYILKNKFLSTYSGHKIRQFADLIIYFKNLFHIRPDNNLKQIIENYNKQQKDWTEDIIHFTFKDDFKINIDLFTDVEKLMQAYRKIINMCIEVGQKRNKNGESCLPIDISFSCYENKEHNSVCFCIHHNNSIYQKSIESTIKRLGESTKNIIDNQINGLCDLYLMADFGDNHYAEVNLWNKNNRVIKTIDKVQGVSYKLEFLRP